MPSTAAFVIWELHACNGTSSNATHHKTSKTLVFSIAYLFLIAWRQQHLNRNVANQFDVWFATDSYWFANCDANPHKYTPAHEAMLEIFATSSNAVLWIFVNRTEKTGINKDHQNCDPLACVFKYQSKNLINCKFMTINFSLV